MADDVLNYDDIKPREVVRPPLEYTKIPEYVKSEIDDICKPRKILHTKHCRDDPTVFAYHLLGIRPYSYQYMFFEHIRKGNKRIVMCTGRQCLCEDEYVYTPNGIKKVGDVREGDLILGGVVRDLFMKQADIYEVHICNGIKIKASAEHPFFTDKGWMTAKQLSEVKRPKPKIMFHHAEDFSFGVKQANQEDGKFLGYMMSDGYYAPKQSPKFTNNNELFLKETEAYVAKKWGLRCNRRKKGNGYDVHFVRSHGTSEANPIDLYLKSLNIYPSKDTFGDIVRFDKQGLIGFIQGYFNGNGYLSKIENKRAKERYEMGLAIGLSRNQAYEMQYILWRLGVLSYVKSEWMKTSTAPFYRVCVNGSVSMLKMIKMLDWVKYPQKFIEAVNKIRIPNGRFERYHYENDGVWMTFKAKKIGRGKVIGWKTEGNNEIVSYCGMRTHNSGKSLSLALIALWASYYNTRPSGIHQNTKVIIISKSEGQAKKLMREIKKLIELGDRKFAIRTKGACKDVLSKELADNQPQTSTQITFRNGCTINSLSPTDSARGSSADILIEDELGFIEEDLHYDVFEPMIAATKGSNLIASTPNGVNGVFYKIFDPLNEKKENPYKRIWIPWWYVEDPEQRELIEQKKEVWTAEGKMRNFQQEYEALFTVAEENFFDSQKVDEAVDRDMPEVMEWKSEPCSIGVDYGWKRSKTAITVVSRDKGGVVRVRLHYAYPNDGSDVNVLEDVRDLKKRFDVKHIVVDSCAEGYLTNQKMINLGWPVTLYNFRTDQAAGERNRGYNILRANMYQGKVKLSNNREMIVELKTLLEIKKMINVSIKAASGCNDDRADSLCMAVYPFLAEDEDDDDIIATQIVGRDSDDETQHPRYDKEWASMTGS